MAAKRFQCVFARSQESVSPGTCPRATMIIPDRESWREKILLDTFEIRSECSFSHHEGYPQHDAGPGRNCMPCGIRVHRRHLYQWRYARDPRQMTSDLVWAGMQRPGTVEGRRISAGTSGRDRTRWIAMEAKKRGSLRPHCRHSTDGILYVWEACWAPLGGVICRTPVSSPARQELRSGKFWPAWTGIKA